MSRVEVIRSFAACPHCGGEDIVADNNSGTSAVCCKTCMAFTLADSPEEARARWNSRPSEHPIIARLIQALKTISDKNPSHVDLEGNWVDPISGKIAREALAEVVRRRLNPETGKAI